MVMPKVKERLGKVPFPPQVNLVLLSFGSLFCYTYQVKMTNPLLRHCLKGKPNHGNFDY